jgi:dihydrofolate reductase
MIISILNCDKEYGIGKKNGLLFDLKEDMRYFRKTTLNHVVAMGENTLLSFPNQKPLKNRTNIVLSSDFTHNYEDVINVHDFQQFLNVVDNYSKREDVYIIGGASMYRQMLPYVDYVYLTKVDAVGHAEVFFVNIDEDENFEVVSESDPVQDGDYTIKFVVYKNKNKQNIH